MRALWLISILFLSLSCAENTEQQERYKLRQLIVPTAENASIPFLFVSTRATLLSWVEKVDDSVSRLRYSELKDGVWRRPHDILSGTDWFVNWADFPSITENNGHLLSHILKKSSEGTYSYDIKMNIKPVDKATWNTDVKLHYDGTPTEHGFVTALPYEEDSFFVTWLDGRNTEEKIGEERGAMTLRAAEVSLKGEITNEKLLDSRTCDCCQTTAAITQNGPVVLYRDRSEHEIRDISIVRRIDGEWTAPRTIHKDNWQIKGCPVNGPKAVAAENVLAVAWFTGTNGQSSAKIAFSNDNGASFQDPVTIATGNVIGRVDIVLLDKNNAIVSYMEEMEGKAQIIATKITASGEVSKQIPIAEISSSRKSGFPQMELVVDQLLFAWTEATKDSSAVMTATIAIQAF